MKVDDKYNLPNGKKCCHCLYFKSCKRRWGVKGENSKCIFPDKPFIKKFQK